MSFGVELKMLREKKGLSQSKLASRAEFDHSYVSRLENETRMPTREAVDRFCDALNCEKGEYNALLVAAGFLPLDGIPKFSHSSIEELNAVYARASSAAQNAVEGTIWLITQHLNQNVAGRKY